MKRIIRAVRSNRATPVLTGRSSGLARTLLAAAGAAAQLAPDQLETQSWQTVGDFIYNGTNTVPKAAAVDGQGETLERLPKEAARSQAPAKHASKDEVIVLVLIILVVIGTFGMFSWSVTKLTTQVGRYVSDTLQRPLWIQRSER